MPESLHTHTTLSDGANTHREMFAAGEQLGFSVLAFTDHDALPNDEQLAFLDSVRGSQMKWILGTEITAGLPADIGNVRDASLHIVGLFVDPKNPALLEHCRKSQEERVQWVKTTVHKLQSLGFEIEASECFLEAGGGSVGKPHVVAVLEKKEANRNLLEVFREKMRKEAEEKERCGDSALKKKYDEMIHYGAGGYPYALFLGRKAYIPLHSAYGYLLDLDAVVAMIRGAGGIASLAHYFTVRNKISLPVLKNLLAAGRIDALETAYRVKPYLPHELPEIGAERAAIKNLIAETKTLATGGPDAHNTEDMESFLATKYLAEETRGMTEKILASGKVQKQWSSF